MKSVVKIDEKLQDELNAKTARNGKIFTIAGGVLMFLYVVFYVFFDNLKFLYTLCLALGGILLCAGLIVVFSIKNVKKSIKGKNFSLSYEFSDDFMNITTLNNEDIVGTNKVYYKDLTQMKITSNYIFLYVNKFQAHPILKSDLSKEELEQLKSWVTEKGNVKITK